MKKRNFQHHPYHLVSPSPWPIYTTLSLWSVVLSTGLSVHGFVKTYLLWYIAITLVVVSMSLWFRDIITEGTFLGDHTLAVQKGLYIGIILFIISEALFFAAIFWAFFHSALTPSIELGSQWPPEGVDPIDPFELPLLNTVILLSSGATITYAHHSLVFGDRAGALRGTIITVTLAIIFTILQITEYSLSSFTISDGIFGTVFFFGTGFHGFHVIIGTIFLTVGLWRIFSYHLTNHHHFGYEAGILYWHFVDIVWLLLYISMYYWGS